MQKEELSKNLQKNKSAKTDEKPNFNKKIPTKIDLYKEWIRYKEANK